MPQRYLLSIDGGGIRGVIPATALVKLERTTGKLTRDVFSFAAGTSTGALISAAVAAGIPAGRIVDIYLKRGREIFSPRAPWNTIKRVASGSMYSTRKLHDVLASEFGAAKDWVLNDSPVDLLLTAKGVRDGKPWYFVKDKPRNTKLTGKLGLVDCATASAAAPTYFSPFQMPKMPDGSPGPFVLADGGVGVAGNPVYQACVEAFYFTGEYTPAETTVVSLGTTRFPSLQQPSGLYGWLTWTLDELLKSPGEQQTEIVQRHFPEMPFYRIDAELKALDPTIDHAIDMDAVEEVERLHRCGEKLADMIDWQEILDGRDNRFRIKASNTNWPRYSVR